LTILKLLLEKNASVKVPEEREEWRQILDEIASIVATPPVLDRTRLRYDILTLIIASLIISVE